jgi:hypothetical protein
MKQKRKTEVVSPVLQWKAWRDRYYSTYFASLNHRIWCEVDALNFLFDDVSSAIRVHVVPRPSRWTATLKIYPDKDLWMSGIYSTMAVFLADALHTLTGKDHGEVHFWLENL